MTKSFPARFHEIITWLRTEKGARWNRVVCMFNNKRLFVPGIVTPAMVSGLHAWPLHANDNGGLRGDANAPD